jgi:hypothetical protein
MRPTAARNSPSLSAGSIARRGAGPLAAGGAANFLWHARPRKYARPRMLADRAPLHSPALLHDKAAALLVREVEFPHGSSFGCFTVRSLYISEDLSALADERRAPGAGSRGAGVTVG